jgi:polar amino acid transport system permease protein
VTAGVMLPVLHPPQCDNGAGRWRCGADAVAASTFTPRMALVVALAAVVAVAAPAVVAAPGQPGIVETLVKWFPLIAKGFAFNVLVSVLAMALGTMAGALLGLGQISLKRPTRGASWLATQFFRNAPWLVLLFYAMFLLPYEIRLGGISIPFPDWVKAVIGLALPVMANVSEVVRGGVLSIPKVQWEAAEALAFNRRQTLWRVILPQCVKRMLPPWMNLYAILTMATPLISIAGVAEGLAITKAALNAESGRSDLLLPFYALLLALFFAYCYPIARYTLKLEAKYAVKG